MKQTIGNTYVISLEKCTVIFPGIQSQLVVMIHTGPGGLKENDSKYQSGVRCTG